MDSCAVCCMLRRAGVLSCSCVPVLVISFFCTVTAVFGGWKLETIDGPKYFHGGWMSGRSLALDSSNQPHIVYGGDHLYHAWLEEGMWRNETVDGASDVGESAAIGIDTKGKLHIAYAATSGIDGQPGVKYATNRGGDWEIFVVDGTESSFSFISIAVDGNRKAHICYYDKANKDLRYATNATGIWRTTTIDSRGYVGHYCSIAVDRKNAVHIAYHSEYTDDLKYATNASGKWVVTFRDSVGAVGFGTSIAVDSKGKVHISYVEGFETNEYRPLKYCSNASGEWKTKVIDGTEKVGYSTSIAVDREGHVHITYYGEENGDLRYATDATEDGKWQVMVADSSGDVGYPNAVAVDGEGKVHAVYLDQGKKNLKYAVGGLGGFTKRVLDRSRAIEWENSLAVDKDDKLHAAYTDDSRRLMYAISASGSWRRSTIDEAGNCAAFVSLAMDSSKKAHITCSLTDGEDYSLKHVTNASGAWKIETVDAAGEPGRYSSIAVDGNDHVHIAHYDQENEDLRYSTNASGSWETLTVDSGGDVGKFTAIAVDSANKVHISYFDGTNWDLKYATNASGAWKTRTIDSTGWVGYESNSIAVDSNGKVHISYQDAANWDLKYATNASGSWKRIALDKAAKGGLCNSIAVDSKGMVHIAYSDWSNYDLKYATNASGSWKYSYVDRIGRVGDESHIALDSQDRVHIGYVDFSNSDLRHATSAPAAATLQIEKQGTGTGLITSASGKIDCGPDCEGRYAKGASEVLTPLAFPESAFTGWGGACSGLGACTLTLGKDKYVTAGFDLMRPMSPSRVKALAMSKTEIALTWKDNSNNESGFKIEGKKSEGGTYRVIGEVGPNVTTFTIGGLDMDTQYSFRVRAFNAKGFSSYSNEANAFTSLFIKVAFPNGGEEVRPPYNAKIGWTWSGDVGNYVRVEVLKGGAFYKTIKSSVPIGEDGYGTTVWWIPYDMTMGTDYKIRVASTTNSTYQDTSNRNFSIIDNVFLVEPGGGEHWKAGGTYLIQWNYTAAVNETVRIELYRGGVRDVVIAPAVSRGTNGHGSYSWTIPPDQTPSDSYRVRVVTADNLFWDKSHRDFTITAP